jgi:glyoxylase-like metal-dependent hydrolase (beta-lactamase superfamily II)
MQHVRTERLSADFKVRSVLTAAFLLAIGFAFQDVFSQSSVESPKERNERVRSPVAAQTTRPEKSNFSVERIGDGVYALIRNEPPSLWFNPNNVFIIGKRSVIVVDSNISSEFTQVALAALRRLTDKPISHVINTHWHEDHIIGNRVYRNAFPEVRFVGHRTTLTDLPSIGASNRKGTVENGPGFVDLLKTKLERGENLAGQKMTDEERRGYTSDTNLVTSYLAESNSFEIILPSVIVDDRLVINNDGRKVEVLYLGRAHTAADLIVRLPKENVIISGDLIVHPVPLVGSTSFPLEYGATLEKVLAMKPRTIIPGHGPVMHDNAYLQSMIELLRSIKRQTEAAFDRGETLEQMRKSVDLEVFRRKFAGDSQHKSFVFRNYVTLSAVAAAYKELSARTTACAGAK